MYFESDMTMFTSSGRGKFGFIEDEEEKPDRGKTTLPTESLPRYLVVEDGVGWSFQRDFLG